MYIITCLYCFNNVKIKRKPSKNRGKYCSALCASKHYHSQPKYKAIKTPNVQCGWCKKDFYKAPSRKSASKSGMVFCCRKHKDLAQRLDGLSEIHPKHYGLSTRPTAHYRTKAFENLDKKCSRCGYNEYEQLLDVHHKDENKLNNDISNLEILCAMCHRKHHLNLK